MLVLGLLTIVAAAGTMTIYKGNRAEETPYLQMGESEKEIAEQETIRPETQVQKDGPSDAQEEHENHQLAENANHTEKKEITEKEKPAEVPASEAEPAGAGQENALALNLDFTENSRMSWPVQGNILLDYSMDSTIYFPTLDQYKCNSGIVIQGEISAPVKAPADAKVTAVGTNEEIGSYAVLDLGNEYSVTSGQADGVKFIHPFNDSLNQAAKGAVNDWLRNADYINPVFSAEHGFVYNAFLLISGKAGKFPYQNSVKRV